MSVIFGIKKHTGEAVALEELSLLARTTERYAPDGAAFKICRANLGMGFQANHTHVRSRIEKQPASDDLGNMLVFDGRLDNWEELCCALDIADRQISDSFLILAAYRRWGEACFSRLLGDWALALWTTANEVLYLARDHAGTRTLYFRDTADMLQWSTYLDTFFARGESYPLNEEYAACYLSSLAIRDLTPYQGIHAVLPAHYLAIRKGELSQHRHWTCMRNTGITYTSDSDYEEHFLSAFKLSVKRRTEPGTPILAQLSGGLDSSSIVCTADLLRQQQPAAELLDTLSYYNDSEPNWNERPFFSIVERQRGKTGTHVETSFRRKSFDPVPSEKGVYFLPGADSSSLEEERAFCEVIRNKEYRVILSGIGGDELLGGMPLPFPELADHLEEKNLRQLLSRSIAWCLVDRSPLAWILLETVKFKRNLSGKSFSNLERVAPWMTARLRKLSVERAESSYADKELSQLLPSKIFNGRAWLGVLETLPHLSPGVLFRAEYRYPYLDRNLVEFLLSIPREQLVRPGHRRSLMRRALKGIVPAEILDRKRKAYLIKDPVASLRKAQPKLNRLLETSLAAEWGLIDLPQFRSVLTSVCEGKELKWMHAVLKTISFELWLQTDATATMLSSIGEQRRGVSFPLATQAQYQPSQARPA